MCWTLCGLSTLKPLLREYGIFIWTCSYQLLFLAFMECPVTDYSVLSWNVRGLNNPAWQHEVKQVVQMFRPQLICMQETKLNHIDNNVIRNALGTQYVANFFFHPADGSRGGILLACNDDFLTLQDAHLTTNTISATVRDSRCDFPWTVTGGLWTTTRPR